MQFFGREDCLISGVKPKISGDNCGQQLSHGFRSHIAHLNLQEIMISPAKVLFIMIVCVAIYRIRFASVVIFVVAS